MLLRPLSTKDDQLSHPYQRTDMRAPDMKKELTFQHFGLLQEIRSVLEDELNVRTPSPIQ